MRTELRTYEMERILLKGVRLLDPAQKLDRVTDMLIEEGTVTRIADGIEERGDHVFDMAGLTLVPGFVDLRSQFGEPGFEDRDTIQSGLDAAAAGGFVAVCAMPESDPIVDNQALVGFLLEQAGDHPVTLMPVGAVTRALQGERLADLGELAQAGAVAVSEGNVGLASAAAVRGALSYAMMFGLPLFSMPQARSLTGGYVHEGRQSLVMGLKGIPRLTEELAVYRDLRCAEFEEARLHLQLLSTRESLELVKAAKERGVRVTADCSPQHLALRDTDAGDFQQAKKLLPPLRPEQDRDALLQACADGTLDAICSDHRPAEFDDLDCDYVSSPFGCASLETAFAVAHRALVEEGGLPLKRLLELFSHGPRRVLDLPECTIAEGEPAAFTLLDLDCVWQYKGDEALSLGVNSPWEGTEFHVRPAGVVNGSGMALRS